MPKKVTATYMAVEWKEKMAGLDIFRDVQPAIFFDVFLHDASHPQDDLTSAGGGWDKSRKGNLKRENNFHERVLCFASLANASISACDNED